MRNYLKFKKNKEQNIKTNITTKQNKLNNLINQIESNIFINKVRILINNTKLLILNVPNQIQNPIYKKNNFLISVFKSNEIINLLEFLKSNFQFNTDINTYIEIF